MRFFGEESVIQVFNNINLVALMEKFQTITGVPANKQSIKVVDENLIRRIDRQIYNKDTPSVLNTLKDLKITDNAAILLEVKNDDEAAQDEELL